MVKWSIIIFNMTINIARKNKWVRNVCVWILYSLAQVYCEVKKGRGRREGGGGGVQKFLYHRSSKMINDCCRSSRNVIGDITHFNRHTKLIHVSISANFI